MSAERSNMSLYLVPSLSMTSILWRSQDMRSPNGVWVEGSHLAAPDLFEQLALDITNTASVLLRTAVAVQVGVLRTVLLPSKAPTCRLVVTHRKWSDGIVFSIDHNQSVTRPLFTISDRTTNSFAPSLLSSIPHLLCHNEELPLKMLQAALIATLARLQDERAQLGLKSQLHLLKQSLEQHSGQIWRKEFGHKDCLCCNTLDGPDEIKLMNWNTCIMHNEKRLKGKRDREETSCHH